MTDEIKEPAVPDELISFINKYSIFLIAGHKEPDGDCIGSSSALSLFLNRIGKTSVLLSAGPFKRAEVKPYENLFLSGIPSCYEKQENTAVIVVDCSNIERTGDLAPHLKAFPTAVIDHHATNSEKSPVSFVYDRAPAAAYLVQLLIEKMSGKVSKEEADFLLFALSSDTGFFRHLDEKSANVFSAVSRLVLSGANPKDIFARINGGKSFGSRILISRVIQRLQPYYNGSLMVSYETYADYKEFGLEGRDTDALYMLIQAIKGVQAIVVVRQESETHCSVGFRSLDKIDVSVIAAEFGGGGHRQASGLYIEGRYEDLIPQFVKAFEPQMKKLGFCV